MKVSVVIPVLYGESQLGETIARLASLRDQVDLEILLVVDVPDPYREPDSRKANDAIAAEGGAEVTYRIGQRGFGSALRFGFAQAAGDAVIPLMGDACDDPKDIPRLVEKIEDGWDIVAGSRYMKGGRIVGNTLKQRMSRLYGRLVWLVGGPRIRDVTNAFKAYRKPVVDTVRTVAESYDFSVELTVKAYQAGFSVTEVPTTWTNRELGQSNWRFSRELWRYTRWLLLALVSRRRARRAPSHSAPVIDRREQR